MLGDNSVTESFAFLLEHLVEEPRWLRSGWGWRTRRRPSRTRGPSKLVMLRRYSAKLAYELELHGGSAALDEMPTRYRGPARRRCRDALAAPRAGWPMWTRASMPPAICGPGRWRRDGGRALRERFGEALVRVERRAGEWLREVWRRGQRLDADELLAETVGGELDVAELAAGHEALGDRAPLPGAPRYLSRRSISASTLLRALPRFSRARTSPQLRRAQIPQPRLDLGGGQLVVGGDRAARRHPGAPAQSIGLSERLRRRRPARPAPRARRRPWRGAGPGRCGCRAPAWPARAAARAP